MKYVHVDDQTYLVLEDFGDYFHARRVTWKGRLEEKIRKIFWEKKGKDEPIH